MTRDDTTRSLKSRLPDDPAYWDALADRISARSTGQIQDYGARLGPWWEWIAGFAPALAAAAVLVLLGTWAFVPPAPQSAVVGQPGIAQLLAPDEPMARAFLADSEPPALAALSWAGVGEEGNR